MTILDTLLSGLPADCRVTDVYVGANWVLALVTDNQGNHRAGVASTPKHIAPNSPFQIGHFALDQDAQAVAQGLRSPDMMVAAVGLAVINALTQPDDSALSNDDAADWLSAQCVGRGIAIFGRFPFIDDEIRPFARQVWVFEQQPQPGELQSTDIQSILPQADIVAITGSSILNHTIDNILPHITPQATVVLLGPSTPLSQTLFTIGIHAMFGVRVVDKAQVIASVLAGDDFQKMNGLGRVALLKQQR